MTGRSKCETAKNLWFGVTQKSSSSQTSWVSQHGSVPAGGWSSQGMTTSPGLVGKALADSSGIEGRHRGEGRAALHDNVSAVKIKHDYITPLS